MQPQSRESAKICSIGKHVYIFGGHALELFNDLRDTIDCDDYFYSRIVKNVGEEGIDFP